MPLHVEPILPRFGAECSGLDLTRPLTSALGMLLTMLAHHVGWPLEGFRCRLSCTTRASDRTRTRGG